MANTPLLTTTSNNGSQNATAAPQQSVAANSVSGGTPSSIQPGNDANSLNNASTTVGIPLGNTNLTTINVGAATSSTVAPARPATPKSHTGWLGISAGLFVLALIVLWYIGRDAKNTTKI